LFTTGIVCECIVTVLLEVIRFGVGASSMIER